MDLLVKTFEEVWIIILFLQARIAANEGVVGLILYTDPIDYSPEGVENTYPKSWWLPPSGVERGTLLPNLEEGDPLTPGYPARGKALHPP